MQFLTFSGIQLYLYCALALHTVKCDVGRRRCEIHGYTYHVVLQLSDKKNFAYQIETLLPKFHFSEFCA